MKKTNLLLVLGIGLLLVFAFAGCAPDEPAEEEPEETEAEEPLSGEALIENRCASCHGLDRVYEERDEETWPGIVESMVDRSPGLLDDEEFDVVVEYLQEHYGN